MKSDYPIRVGIADDHQYLRSGLDSLLSVNPGFQLVVEAVNGQDLLDQVAALAQPPDICLLDIHMPVLDGYQTLDVLTKRWPSVKVVVLSAFSHEFAIIDMLRRGAVAFVPKEDPSDLCAILEAVHHTGHYYNNVMNGDFQKLMGSNAFRLTPKEREFLKYCSSDMSYKEIAREMHISPHTADGYRSALFEKLRVQSRIGLALLALHAGII